MRQPQLNISLYFLIVYLQNTTNRYGNETISTGLIHVTRHVVMQNDTHFLNDQTIVSDKNDHKYTIQHLTIDDVVTAYHKAKLRLEATTTTV